MMNYKYFIAALLGTTLVACSGEKEQTHDVLNVETETVSSREGQMESSYVGQIEEGSATTLSFTGSGTIKQMLVSEGQWVSRGQLVAVLDEAQMQHALSAAEATLAQAQDGYNRLKQVHDAGSLAEQKWIEIQSQLQQARSSRDMARKALQDCRLVSPVSGVVGTVSLEAGETALPSMPVCTVLNIDRVKVRVSIPEREIASITSSTPSQITVAALGSEVLQGGTIEKGVTADAITRSYDIKIQLANGEHRLLPGMVASVKLDGMSAAESAELITLPVVAVQERANGQKFVWTVSQGKAARTDVEIGALVDNRVVIERGVKPGDVVIVEGYQKVSEGAQVNVVEK